MEAQLKMKRLARDLPKYVNA
jgi:hypothetical protein